jgi:ubiquinone/menaquinone biosynthesis C-methylase UbiE
MPPENINELYKKHPLRQETILARIRKQRKSLEGISELDLAFDPEWATTDQNHVGGIGFVVELAKAARINSATRVVDLGCGLGGSMRVLSYLYGCKTVGYDISEERVADARDLTHLVNLDDFVEFKHADLMTCEVSSGQFDVIWGQSSWTHMQQKGKFLKRWAGTLKSGGMIAFEDLYLRRNAEVGNEETLAGFEADSMSKVVELQKWKQILTNCSFSITTEEDLSHELLKEERKLTRTENAISGEKNPKEREKTNLLLELAERGILGYFRLVAKRHG